MSMRQGYYDLRKLAGMTEPEWDQLAEEELDEILTLLQEVTQKRTDSMGRLPKGSAQRPTISQR